MIDLNGMNLKDHRDLPKSIHQAMVFYNLDLVPMPKEYIEFHRGIGQEVLATLVAMYGIRVIGTTMRDAGWFDGMKELNAIVEDRFGRVHRLVYCDQNQGFMVKCEHGGSGYANPDRLFDQP
jgi:hypothetical protein